MHPDDKNKVCREIVEQLDQQEHFEVEYRWKHGDGTYHWYMDRGVIVKSPNGRPDRVIGSWTDITAAKQAEALLENERELFEMIARSVE